MIHKLSHHGQGNRQALSVSTFSPPHPPILTPLPTDVTHSEHSDSAGLGKHSSNVGFRRLGTFSGQGFKKLPFDCCALSLVGFETPVLVREGEWGKGEGGRGSVFELTRIV